MCYPPKEEDHTYFAKLKHSALKKKNQVQPSNRVVDLVPFFECFKPLLLNEHTTILLKKGPPKVSNAYICSTTIA